MNIWHDIDSGLITPQNFVSVVEIPAYSKKKYELDKKTGLLRLDRVLHTSTHYPANYGFIPRTYADDNDPLDVLILCSESLDPKIMVESYPIGVIRMMDEEDCDDKIIAIAAGDPTWNYYKEMAELPPHITDEIAHFFEVYKQLEGKYTATEDTFGRKEAEAVIADCIARYERHFCGIRK